MATPTTLIARRIASRLPARFGTANHKHVAVLKNLAPGDHEDCVVPGAGAVGRGHALDGLPGSHERNDELVPIRHRSPSPRSRVEPTAATASNPPPLHRIAS